MMTFSKEDLIKVLSDYISKDLLADSKDLSLKTMASALVKFLKFSPELLDGFFENPMVKSILSCDEHGNYDVEKALNIVKEVIDENGKFYLIVPSIPFIYPDGKRLGLTSSDIEKLVSRLHAEKSSAENADNSSI